MLSQRPRVLVVEDEAPIRTTLEVALRGEGYEVRAEPDGRALEEVFGAFRPDLAVLTSGCRSDRTATAWRRPCGSPATCRCCS
jgi:DNA-binding response OmpR family regulator